MFKGYANPCVFNEESPANIYVYIYIITTHVFSASSPKAVKHGQLTGEAT
jgi:hypothetical protein